MILDLCRCWGPQQGFSKNRRVLPDLRLYVILVILDGARMVHSSKADESLAGDVAECAA